MYGQERNSSSCLPSLSWGRGGGLYPHRLKPGNRTQTPTPISLSKDHPHRAELHGRATVVLFLTTTTDKSITKKSYSATIDHPAIESSSIKALPCLPHTSSDGRFQRENSLSKNSLRFAGTCIYKLQSTCLRLTCYHALVRHAYRPGQSELGMADCSKKACSSPSAFPAEDQSASCASLFVCRDPSALPQSLDRHVKATSLPVAS